MRQEFRIIAPALSILQTEAWSTFEHLFLNEKLRTENLRLWGKSVKLDELESQLEAIESNDSDYFIDLSDNRMSFQYTRPLNTNFIIISIQSDLYIDWDELISVFSRRFDDFITALCDDIDYKNIQNETILGNFDFYPKEYYPSKDKIYENPANPGEFMVNIIKNPGRDVIHYSFLEAVSSQIWLGKSYWTLLKTDRTHIINNESFEVRDMPNGIVKIQVQNRPFTSSTGVEGTAQDQLRQMLFGT